MEVFLKEKSGFPLARMPIDPVGVPSFLLQAWGWQLVPPATRVAEWQTLHPVIPMETSVCHTLSAEMETYTKSTFSLSLLLSVCAQMWKAKWKMLVSSNWFFFWSSFQWEVKIYSFASLMQFVRKVKALSISAALQLARVGKEILASKMYVSFTWAGRITAVMVSITAGIHYLAESKLGGMWQTVCHVLLVMWQKREQLVGLLSSVLQNLNILPSFHVIIHHDH